MHRFIWEWWKILSNTIYYYYPFLPYSRHSYHFFHLSISSPQYFPYSPLLSFSLFESNFLTSQQSFLVSSDSTQFFCIPTILSRFHQILFSLGFITLPPNYRIFYPILQSTCLLFYYYFHLFINVNGNWLAY
mgnify:CR=1 FL=1